MSGSGRLDLRNKLATVVWRRPINAVLKRFGPDIQSVIYPQTVELMNELVRNFPKFDPKAFLAKTLPAAAQVVDARQFREGIAFATHLAKHGVNPSYALQYGLPAVALNSRSHDAFKTNLLYLEALVGHLHEQGFDTGKPFFVAVRAAAKDLDVRQFTASLVLATRLAEAGTDPAELLRFGIPAAAQALTGKQFRQAMTLATQTARNGGPVGELLGSALPDVAREVSPVELTAGLQLALHLEEKNIQLPGFFTTGLHAIVVASATPELFRKNLELLAALMRRLQQKGIELQVPLSALANDCVAQDDFRSNVEALYRFAVHAGQQNVSPRILLRRGFAGGVAQSPEVFQSTLQTLITVVSKLRAHQVNEYLLTYIIEYGLDRVAKNSLTVEDFRKNLTVMVRSFGPVVRRDIEENGHRKAATTINDAPDAFVIITDAMSPSTQLSGGLALVYEMATSAHYDWKDTPALRFVEMAGEVAALVDNGTEYAIKYDSTDGPTIVEPKAGLDAFRSRVRGKDSPRPGDQTTVTKGPVTKGPVTKGPVTKGPVTKGPVTKGPVTKGPVTKDP